ncbi:MAG TPA: magnesium chelatase, partial [Candidatus Korarchaeota archaeon]|nr:magnesium chelatase [Candidatus Korarchaeota archaeon]
MSATFDRRWLRYPFAALVGLEELKLALLAVVVNPKIGGLLIRGPKGSGKSTAVRALEDLLPEITVVKGCRFHCDPSSPNLCWECRERIASGENPLPTQRIRMRVVTLPLSATEDRVVGSLDVEATLKSGTIRFRPGILADANRNILYVDEINLLPDYLVDDLLDVAASGVNVVEREGVSVEHPSEFILIGSMNPEEGELRPQLLDRLALSVTVEGSYSPEEREEIIRRNAEFKADPVGFYRKYAERQEEIRGRIAKAREILPRVRVPDEIVRGIAELCYKLEVDGVRPDIAIYETARALAALRGSKEVDWEDVRIAAKFALAHRTRAKGTLEPASPEEIEGAISVVRSESERRPKKEKRKVSPEEAIRKGRIRLPAVPVPVPFFLLLMAALGVASAMLLP